MANTTTTTTSGIDPEFKKYYATLFNQAGKSIFETDAEGKVIGVKPFQQYQGEQIAGFTPQQLAVQQQMAQLQTPQGFAQGAQGLNQAQQMAFAAGNQGLNQAFGYQPQAPASLAIPQQSWFPSGSNQPQQPQPAPNPLVQGLQSVSSKIPTQTPQQQQAFQQGMGISNVGGQLTFADQGSPFVSSATPSSTMGQGMVDARLASRGMPPQIEQTFTTDGGLGAPRSTPPQQSPQLSGSAAYNAEFSRLNPGVPINNKWDAAGQQNYIKDLLSRQTASGGSQYQAPQGFADGGVVVGQDLVNARLASRGMAPQTTATTQTTTSTPAISSTPTGITKFNPYAAAAPTQTPQQQQAFQQGMGINNVGGQLTFAPGSAAVSSATPSATMGQGMVDARLASRGMAPQNTTAPPSTPTTQASSLGAPTTPTGTGWGAPTTNTTGTGWQPTPKPAIPPVTGPVGGFTPNGNNGFGPAAPILPNPPQQPMNNGNGGFGPAAPAFSQQPDASAYESKYQQGVTDIALREAQRQADLQRQAGAMSSIGRGTFGGARQALIQSEADRNNAQNMAAVQAMGSQAGFQNAQQQFNADRASNIGVQTQNQNTALRQQELAQAGQQFQAGLGRDIGLAGLQYGIGSSTNLGNLSAQQQQGDLARLQMQGSTAAQQQALQQQINDRAMQDYYTAQQYPMQQLDRYGNILRGNQSAMGSVGTTTTPQGSLGAQLVGGALAAGSIYGQNSQAINSGLGSLWNFATGNNNSATDAAMNAFGY